MKMRLLAAAVLLMGLGVVNKVTAQTSAMMTNCAALSGSPMMCVKNNSSYPVVGIQATTGMQFGSDWIPIPGGMIPPGGTTVVRFPVWGTGCMKYVVVKTMSGSTHVFPGVNVCQSTSFLVNGW